MLFQHLDFTSKLLNTIGLVILVIFYLLFVFREYMQYFHEVGEWLKRPFEIPTAVACFPKDLPCSPKALLSDSMPKMVQYTDLAKGGHFAAMEEPEDFVNDFRAAAQKFLA